MVSLLELQLYNTWPKISYGPSDQSRGQVYNNVKPAQPAGERSDVMDKHKLKMALEDIERLEALYSAVDAYLYDAADNGYPEGHTNPDKLEPIREVFLEITRSGGDTAIDLVTQVLEQ